MNHPTPTWRRLFAAALLAAVFVSPSFADDDASTAERADKAVRTGNFDALFTGARQHSGTLRLPTPGFFANGNGPGVNPPAPIDQKEIDRYFQMDGGTAQEKEFTRKMTAKLQTSKTGNEILANIIADCKARGDVIHVVMEDFKGSSIKNFGGVEQISGLSGEAGWEKGQRVFRFNRKFLDFKDQDAALQLAAANAGHELAHFNFGTYFQQQIPDYADLVEFVLINEQNARIKGFLVAAELNTGKPNGDILEAKELAEHPQAFMDEMKTWDPVYAAALQQKELLDPIPAYEIRLKALKERKESLEDDVAEGYALILKQIDHMTKEHAALVAEKKLAVPLSLLRANIVKGQEAGAFNIKHTQESIDRVLELEKVLNGPKGALLKQRLKDLALNPRYAALIAEHRGDQKELKADVEKLNLEVIPDENKPMSWGQFKELFKKIHGMKVDGPAPWNEPQ